MEKIKNYFIVQYHDNMGELRFPNGFEEHLKELMPEYDLVKCYSKSCRTSILMKQMRCYGWSELKRPVEWNDPRLTSHTPNFKLQEIIHPIMMDWEKIRLIVKDDMMVGVMLDDLLNCHFSDKEASFYYEEHSILPYDGYVYDSTSDNNGAGYKERELNRYLICLPYNHNLW